LTYASAIFLSIAFVALARYLGLVARPMQVVAASREAYRTFTDSTLDDDEKEAIMQRSAKTFARHFVFIFTASLAAIAAPMGVVWGLAVVGLVSVKAVVGALLSWRVLLASTILIGVEAWFERVLLLGTH